VAVVILPQYHSENLGGSSNLAPCQPRLLPQGAREQLEDEMLEQQLQTAKEEASLRKLRGQNLSCSLFFITGKPRVE